MAPAPSGQYIAIGEQGGVGMDRIHAGGGLAAPAGYRPRRQSCSHCSQRIRGSIGPGLNIQTCHSATADSTAEAGPPAPVASGRTSVRRAAGLLCDLPMALNESRHCAGPPGQGDCRCFQRFSRHRLRRGRLQHAPRGGNPTGLSVPHSGGHGEHVSPPLLLKHSTHHARPPRAVPHLTAADWGAGDVDSSPTLSSR